MHISVSASTKNIREPLVSMADLESGRFLEAKLFGAPKDDKTGYKALCKCLGSIELNNNYYGYGTWVLP